MQKIKPFKTETELKNHTAFLLRIKARKKAIDFLERQKRINEATPKDVVATAQYNQYLPKPSEDVQRQIEEKLSKLGAISEKK